MILSDLLEDEVEWNWLAISPQGEVHLFQDDDNVTDFLEDYTDRCDWKIVKILVFK